MVVQIAERELCVYQYIASDWHQWSINLLWQLLVGFAVDFEEVKTAPTECKEKCFQMMSSSYLHCSKAPQNELY